MCATDVASLRAFLDRSFPLKGRPWSHRYFYPSQPHVPQNSVVNPVRIERDASDTTREKEAK